MIKTGIRPHLMALGQGKDLQFIQKLLGHIRSTTTEIYTHVAAHKKSEIRSPIAGLLQNRTGKGE
jgi:site-specific recombinase XerD